jgi:hypothetical protein
MRLKQRRKVLLPQPDAPIRAVMRLAASGMLTSSTALKSS